MKKSIIVIIVILLFSTVVIGNNIHNPQSLALGDAYITRAYGFQALDWNPANLGLIRNFTTINIFQVDTNILNNSFDLKTYNETVGDFLDDGEKQNLLDKIPSLGFDLNAKATSNIPFTTLSIWKCALSINAHIISSLKLSKEFFNCALHGTEVGVTYDFSDTKGGLTSFIETKIGYGDKLPISFISPIFNNFPPIYAGVSFGYLAGVGYAKINNFKSRFVINDDGTSIIENNIEFKTAGYDSEDSTATFKNYQPAGNGFRTNIGFYSQITEDISFGLSFNNIFGKINWTEDCEEIKIMFFSDTTNVLNLDDSLLVDTTYSIDPFSQKIPFEIHFGASYKLSNFNFSLDYVQGFDESAFTSKESKISFGVEYKLLQWLPLRIGFGFGEGKSSHYSFGSGFEFKKFEFSWAFRNYASPLSSYAKGFAFSIGSQLNF